MRSIQAHAHALASERGAFRDHRPDVQGLRALAVILVVLFHAELPVRGGFIGVEVFLVISGFVITQLLWAGSFRRVSESTCSASTPAARGGCYRRSSWCSDSWRSGPSFLRTLRNQQLTAKTGVAASFFVANASGRAPRRAPDQANGSPECRTRQLNDVTLRSNLAAQLV